MSNLHTVITPIVHKTPNRNGYTVKGDTICFDPDQEDGLTFYEAFTEGGTDFYGRLICFSAKEAAPGDTEDIVHETFLKLSNRFYNAEQSKEAFKVNMSYMIFTAHNLIRSKGRRSGFHKKWVDSIKNSNESNTKEFNTCLAERADVNLANSLKELKHNEERTIRLTVLAGLTNKQAAAVLGVPTSTVVNWKRRAIQNLTKLVDAKQGAGRGNCNALFSFEAA